MLSPLFRILRRGGGIPMNTLRLHTVRFPLSETFAQPRGMKISRSIPSPFERES